MTWDVMYVCNEKVKERESEREKVTKRERVCGGEEMIESITTRKIGKKNEKDKGDESSLYICEERE